MKTKEVLTWSLRINNDDYRHDFEQYGNKITSLGFHEWDVDAAGNISIYALNPQKNSETSVYNDIRVSQRDTYTDGNGVTVNRGDYIFSNGNKASSPQPGWNDATTYDRYAEGRNLFPNLVEPDMRRWEHIEYYIQMVIFGPETVSRLLDSQAAQTKFIQNLKKVYELHRVDQRTGQPIHYTGLEIDCEGSFSDAKWNSRSGDDRKLMDLLKRIKHEIILDHHPHLKLRANAHAMWGPGTPSYYRFHNYKMWAEETDRDGNAVLDEVQIMTYDHSWGGSAPGPSTPLWWMRDVAEWCRECFDPEVNPNAKVTIDKVYLGGAGYGRRWGINTTNNSGSSVTYRDLVDWQNANLIHHIGGGIMANQEFLPMAGINDPNSDNQMMYNHAYDYFRAKYMKNKRGNITDSTYNQIEYATAYSKRQIVHAKGLKGVTGVKGQSEPTHNLHRSSGGVFQDPKREEEPTVNIGGQSFQFQGYRTFRRPYVPAKLGDGTDVCALSPQPNTVLTYKLNVQQAGSYKLAAVVSFPFFGQDQLGGKVNGSDFYIGRNIPDYYPMMVSGSHVWDMGTYDLQAGENTIIIEGTKSRHGTIIFGFFACDELDLEFIGGTGEIEPNIIPFKKRDGSTSRLPDQLVMTSEVLRQSPRPVIMWEDFFGHFVDTRNGHTTFENLQNTSYYTERRVRQDNGGGTLEDYDDFGVLVNCYQEIESGYSRGSWQVRRDHNNTWAAAFNRDYAITSNDVTTRPNTNITNAQLMLNHTFGIHDVSIEAQFRVMQGNEVGIRFSSGGPGDGYLFLADYQNHRVQMIREVNGQRTVVASSPLAGDGRFNHDSRVRLRVLVNNGKCRCYVANNMYFMDMDLPHMKDGSMGFYAGGSNVYLYMMSIGTTQRWETLERFSLITEDDNGNEVEQKMGEIERPGIQRDEWGFLMYSGFNEINIRKILRYDGNGNPIRESISLDYVFYPALFDAWEGKRTVRIKLTDAGLWYKMLFIGDSEGMSITYAGDEESLNRAMNIAVYEYNCKGIGLWTLGQADPRIYEMLPDVVPWHP
ncbi:putative glycosyl hydrolase [Bacillus phage vB_BpsM-61]|nr:putative glycosyl hydrolase [Bacillus phage vB_BpsM-61]